MLLLSPGICVLERDKDRASFPTKETKKKEKKYLASKHLKLYINLHPFQLFQL